GHAPRFAPARPADAGAFGQLRTGGAVAPGRGAPPPAIAAAARRRPLPAGGWPACALWLGRLRACVDRDQRHAHARAGAARGSAAPGRAGADAVDRCAGVDPGQHRARLRRLAQRARHRPRDGLAAGQQQPRCALHRHLRRAIGGASAGNARARFRQRARRRFQLARRGLDRMNNPGPPGPRQAGCLPRHSFPQIARTSPMNRKIRINGRRLLALGASGAIALTVLAGCSGGHAAEQMPPPEVGVAEVPVRPGQQWDEFSGRIEAVESVELRPRVSGYIESVNFREGQEVKKGDVLFTIDDRTYRAELARAQAALARARAQAEVSRSEAERARVLSQEQAISVETWEQRRAAAEQAQADLAAAQAAVDAAKLDLEWTRVRAPIDGRAGRALVTAGNLVSADNGASVLTTLVSLDKVHVHFDADERSFLRYAELARSGKRASEREGTLPVQVALADEEGFPHAGTIDFLDNQVDRSTGTIRARAVLDNADRRFTPGLYARVRLPGSGRFEAALVDDKAVLTDQDRKYVYVVDEEGKAQRRDIVVGRLADGLRIVEQGLSHGDKVIVTGVQKVFFPGMPVR